MSRDIFHLVMEAEGDSLQPFDAGDMSADDVSNNDPIPQEPSPGSNDAGEFEGPPPLTEDEDLSFSGDGGDDEDSEDTNDNESNKEDEKLSENANNILNQRLYQKMINRNDDVDEILKNLQLIVPSLPFEVVKSNDLSVNRLKTALNKGRNYVINKFVDSKYGENLLFYEKLNSLYTLLIEDINKNLKKSNKS